MIDPNQKLQSAANDVADHLAESVTDSTDSAHEAVQHVSDKAASAVRSAKRMAGQVSHAVGEGYDHVSQAAGDSYRKGREVARRWEHRVEGSVQQHPLTTILTAAGVGMLLGILLTMKSRRD